MAQSTSKVTPATKAMAAPKKPGTTKAAASKASASKPATPRTIPAKKAAGKTAPAKSAETSEVPPKKVAAKRAAPKGDGEVRTSGKTAAARGLGVVTPEQRYRMICDAAYFRAERRGFVGGNAVQDWLDAEAEIDELLREMQQ